MCGINGFIGESAGTVAKMNATIRHRGPDDTGVFSNGSFTIGNNRLAIIDLSPLGHQPMISADGRYSIAYNGEVYNHKDIRTSLEGMGVSFKSHSDTEVILEGYAKWGPEITKRLRGMWAFAILDSKENKLFLSRDPFGIKPLYLYNDGTTIAFSSEIRGLLANENIDRSIDQEAMREIILLGYAVAPRTILKNAKSVLPGEEITVDLTTKNIFKKINSIETELTTPPSDDELEKILKDSVEHHLIADVGVGLFFSGGTDSTVLGVMLKELGVHLTAYHVAIGNRNDTPYAEAIAKELGLSMTTVSFDTTIAQERLGDAISALDQPIADTSFLPTMLVSERAKADVKVVLSGEGGDELFGGYLRHGALASLPLFSGEDPAMLPFNSLLQKMPGLLRAYPHMQGMIRLISSLNKDAVGRYLGEMMFGSPFDDSSEIRNSFKKRLEGREHPDGILAIDRLIFLPEQNLQKIDTATMSQSVEGRVPFIDRAVWKKVGATPLSWKMEGGIGKAPLKRLLKKHLPSELVDRPKTGFSTSVHDLLKPDDLRESVHWYLETMRGLLPAYDSVLSWGFEKHPEILMKNISHSLYATHVLRRWLEKNNLTV